MIKKCKNTGIKNNILEILEILKSIIPIKLSKNNKNVYISKVCPFCKEQGKRPFRYNIKLKVGKSYCCGKSFKEKYSLIKQLNDFYFMDKLEIINKLNLFENITEKEQLQLLNDIQDKINRKNIRFEKIKTCDDDLDLPF